MVSNHFQHVRNKYSWLILAIIKVGSAGQALAQPADGSAVVWVLPGVRDHFAGGCIYSAHEKPGPAKAIFLSPSQCHHPAALLQCHSSKPTDDIYKAPPTA